MILPILFDDVIFGIETWIARNMDNVVSNYVRQWLDLPMSETLSSFALPMLNAVIFLSCLTLTFRNANSSYVVPQLRD